MGRWSTAGDGARARGRRDHRRMREKRTKSKKVDKIRRPMHADDTVVCLTSDRLKTGWEKTSKCITVCCAIFTSWQTTTLAMPYQDRTGQGDKKKKGQQKPKGGQGDWRVYKDDDTIQKSHPGGCIAYSSGSLFDSSSTQTHILQMPHTNTHTTTTPSHFNRPPAKC